MPRMRRLLADLCVLKACMAPDRHLHPNSSGRALVTAGWGQQQGWMHSQQLSRLPETSLCACAWAGELDYRL